MSADGFPAQTSAVFQVTAGGTADAGTIALREGHALAGTVRSRLGTPLEGARLFLLSGDTQLNPSAGQLQVHLFGEERVPDGVSDAEGRFELPPQTPGVYGVLSDHVHAAPALTRDVDLRSGARPDLEIVLEPAGEVVVRVLDAQGRPAADVDVALVHPNGAEQLDETEEDGSLRWPSVPVGPCLVRALTLAETGSLHLAGFGKDDARAQAYEALRREGGEQVVRAGEVTEVVLRLPRRTDVTLRVRPWGPDLGRLPYMMVRHAPSEFRRWVYTDESGTFRVSLEPGEYEARVLPEAGWEAARTFKIVVPDLPSHTIELE